VILSLAGVGSDKYINQMLDEATIEQMSSEEQIKAMELLWRALARNPGSVQSPSWHGNVIQERLAKIESGAAKFLSLDEVKRRLRETP